MYSIQIQYIKSKVELQNRTFSTVEIAILCFFHLTVLTWDHLDGCVDFFPVPSSLKLPVQDEVTVISNHRTLWSYILKTAIIDCFASEMLAPL